MPIKGNALLNKLILLFVFDKMEVPMSESIIEEICSSANNWLSYMDLKPTISQLLENSFIYQQTTGSNPIYSITPNGRVCLADFFINIPTSIRENISKFVKTNKTKYRKKQEYFADYFRNNDGTFTVYLKILETAGAQMELRFVVSSRETAENIYSKWPDKAENIYALLYEGLVD